VRLVKLSFLEIGLQLFHTPNGRLTFLCFPNNVDLRILRRKSTHPFLKNPVVFGNADTLLSLSFTSRTFFILERRESKAHTLFTTLPLNSKVQYTK
jgi:hypothetical protein